MQPARLLLADRNRHVREFLKRELEAEGYRVVIARSAQEILTVLAGEERFDLLILDLEVPYVVEADLFPQLQTFYPALPILIHSFQPDNPQALAAYHKAIFLEKNEDPARLKETVAALLRPGGKGSARREQD
ncbi:MAG: response regulator [Desulfobacca sp.]|uniref:response regulator n=1 Tax=Desulfobacca sp. TaxID=2067990 RepID=UPI00404A01C4